MNYQLQVPYPCPCRPARLPDRVVVARLRQLLAGRSGVLTAGCCFVQAAAQCRVQGQEEWTRLFEAAAQTAGCQLRVLTEMLVCCGGEAAFFVPEQGQRLWWSARWVGGSGKAGELLRQALGLELAACTACRELLSLVPDSFQPCIERLLADAQCFAAHFRTALWEVRTKHTTL